jgi:hypothetical protein
MVGLVAGCGDKKNAKDTKSGTSKGEQDEHAHHDEGPHGGHIIELGGPYHAELTHDDETMIVAVYLLGEDVKKAATSKDHEITLSLTVDGKPQEYKLGGAAGAGDPAGEFSRFESKDEKLIDALHEPKYSSGRLRVTIAGKQYSGDIEPHEHGDHEHDKK